MPSKGRWALNPRKWFGISHSAHKRDQKTEIHNPIVQFPVTVTKTLRTTISTPSIHPRILTSRNKTKVLPTSSVNNTNNNSTNTLTSFTQLQLQPFCTRREKTSVLLSSSSTTALFNHTNAFLPTHIQRSIQKNNQIKQEFSIDKTRCNNETIVCDISKSLLSLSLSSQNKNNSQENLLEKQIELNLSEQCLINYSRDSSNDCIENSLSPMHSPSSLSIDDNDERDESSSSGIFTDERADLTDHHRTHSKDTLSTVEVLSIESIADSQISLNRCQSRSAIQPYRLPLSTFDIINTKPSQLQRQIPVTRSNRAHSAENILKDNSITTSSISKSRQSSAAIVKKIEKRIPTNRSPPVTLEKAGFRRIANATYRLTTDKDDHLYRRQRRNSIIEYSNNEDSLPPANNEESYATLPRTSSTEQLDNNIQNDLRAIVDDYLKPMIDSINKTTNYRPTKSQHRSRRSQNNNNNNNNNNNEHNQINIDDITDKLLSSIDCSTYAQYQRCY